MPETLDGTLHALAPFVTGALISHESLWRAAQVVRDVPSAATPHLGFECPLGVPQAVADFGFLIHPGHGGPSILADLVLPRPHRGSADRVWERIRRLCRCWTDRSSEMAGEIRELWCEFDLVDQSTPEDVAPSVFVRRAPATAPEERPPRLGLDRVLAALTERPLTPAVNRTVDACLEAASSTGDVTYVGLMLGRSGAPLRLCIRGLAPGQLARFLSRIGWSGSSDAVEAGLLPLALLADRFTLAVDAGEVVGPRVGLECRLDADAASVWQPFLDALVARGACTEAKRDAVLRWTEWMLPLDAIQVPSGHAAERIWLHGLRAVPRLVPTIMHVKVSCGLAGPVEAKAYLGVGLRWQLDPDSAAVTGILQSRK